MPAITLIAEDIMSSPVYAVSPRDTVAYARNLMVRHKISRVLVMDGVILTGIITQKDIGYRLLQHGARWRKRLPDKIPVGEYATKDLITVDPATPAKKVAGIFMEKNIGGVPVIVNGMVSGIVTKSDLMMSDLVATMRGVVRDVMEDAITVNLWHSLSHVVALMKERDKKLVVTNNDGSVAGIITETSLAFHGETRKRSGESVIEETGKKRKEHIRTMGPDPHSVAPLTAGDLMASPAVTVAPGSAILYAVNLMHNEQVNNLVVVEHDTLVGILKRDDIIKEVAK